MKTRAKKNILSIVAFILVCLLFPLSSCAVDCQVINELPDEEVVCVIKVVVDENGEETEAVLSEKK